MKVKRGFLTIGALLCAATAGCIGIISLNGDVEQVEVAIGSVGPTAHAASVAMAAMAGDVAKCARVLEHCDGHYPCMGQVEVEIGPECPLPLGGSGEGIVVVEGTWHSPHEATVGASFTNVEVGGCGLVLVEASNVLIHWDPYGDGETWVSFSDADVEVSAWRGVLVSSSDFDVVIEHNDTPDDPSDDAYVVDGSSVLVHNTTTRTLDLRHVIMDPACRLNPIAGSGELVEVGLMSVSVVDVTFHDTCDGEVEVHGSHGRETLPFDVLD